MVIETIGVANYDFEAAGETRTRMITSGESHRRYARRGGPFLIEGIAPDDWVAIEIIDIEVGPSLWLLSQRESQLVLRGYVALRLAWLEMVALIIDRYNTTYE